MSRRFVVLVDWEKTTPPSQTHHQTNIQTIYNQPTTKSTNHQTNHTTPTGAHGRDRRARAPEHVVGADGRRAGDEAGGRVFFEGCLSGWVGVRGIGNLSFIKHTHTHTQRKNYHHKYNNILQTKSSINQNAPPPKKIRRRRTRRCTSTWAWATTWRSPTSSSPRHARH